MLSKSSISEKQEKTFFCNQFSSSHFSREECKLEVLGRKFVPEAEFIEFELRFKFKPRLKYGWFHLKLYKMLQDLSRRSIETGFLGFETRFKFIESEL